MKRQKYYINYESDTKTYDVIDCTDPIDQPIVASFRYEGNAETHLKKLKEIEVWKGIISNMSNEEIERRSLLVMLDDQTERNKTFQYLLTKEYNRRKKIESLIQRDFGVENKD